MNQNTLHDRLSTNLSILKHKIEIENSSNNMGLNLLLETTFLNIFNIIYDYNCTNTNSKKNNFSGIDGIDDANGLMVQVTSTFSVGKIETTVKKIIDHKLYEPYKELIFLLLKDKGTLSKASKEKLASLIDGKFVLNFDKGIIGFTDLYRLLVTEGNLHKIIRVNTLLEQVFLDIHFDTGIDFIGLSFDEEEVAHASYIIPIIAELGYKAAVDTIEHYNKLVECNPKLVSSIVLFNDMIVKENLKNFILIVSNHHIVTTINAVNPSCKIFSHFYKKELKPLVLVFDEVLNPIDNKHYNTPRFVSISNPNKIKNLVRGYLKPVTIVKYNFDLIKNVLKSLFPTHTFRTVTSEDEKYFCLCNLTYRNSALNFLIFSHDFRRSEVLQQFEEKYLKGYSSSLTILVPKDYNQPTNLRLKFINDHYDSRYHVHFLDEFLYEESLKNIKQLPFFSDEIFISPYFKIDNDYEKLEDIFEWLKNDETSVAFIIGSGGDGKTTVCQKIHDVIVNDFENNIVIFLDAQSYIEQIKRRDRIDHWKFDLQTVFEISNTEVGGIDINTFKSNFAFGNITVIIDGIDEIISTLPNFSLSDFLKDFTTLEETIGKGKLIINCRDIYINELLQADLDFQSKNKIFNLLKFNDELVGKYFKKYFNNDGKKVGESLKLLQYFYEDINGEEFIYSPFLLEIISNIVENNFDYDEIEVSYDSEILVKKNSNDYLIYKICKREIAKKENHGFIIGVDDYVRLLGLIAVEKNGVFTDEDFTFLLKKLNINLSSEKVKNSLRDNPFFHFKDENYHFRFDFYNLYFKNNLVYSKIILKSSFALTDTFITLLSKELKFNSLLFNGLKKKFSDSEFDFKESLMYFNELVNGINNIKIDQTNGGYEYIKQKAISNILVFLNEIKSKEFSVTDIVLNLFSAGDSDLSNIVSIEYLYLIDIPSNIKLEIDFTNLYVSNSVIEGFPRFLECLFNQNTYFDHSIKISNVQNENLNLKKCTATKDNFDNQIILSDNSLHVALRLVESGGEDLPSYLRKYFRTFLKSGRLMDKIEANHLPKNTLISLSLDELNSILLNHSLLSSFDRSEIFINTSVKSKILKFIQQNMTFSELNKAIKQIQIRELNGK